MYKLSFCLVHIDRAVTVALLTGIKKVYSSSLKITNVEPAAASPLPADN